MICFVFKAKSYDKLGNSDKASEPFKELASIGQRQREGGTDNTLIAVEEGSSGNNQGLSDAYCLEALANKGLGNQEVA